MGFDIGARQLDADDPLKGFAPCAKSSRTDRTLTMGTPHILVIDRYLPFRMSVYQYLSGRGHPVTEAEDYAEGMEILWRERVSLVLMESDGRDEDFSGLIQLLRDAGT